MSPKPSIEPSTTTTTPRELGDDPLTHPAVVRYQTRMKPKPGLSIQQCELIAAEVVDLPTWDQVLTIFAGNEHRGRDGSGRMVGNALDRYRREVQREQARPPTAKVTPISTETSEQKQIRLARIVAQQAQQNQRTA